MPVCIHQQPYPALKSIYLDTGGQQRGTFRNKRTAHLSWRISKGETREPTCSPFPSFPRKRTRGILTWRIMRNAFHSNPLSLLALLLPPPRIHAQLCMRCSYVNCCTASRCLAPWNVVLMVLPFRHTRLWFRSLFINLLCVNGFDVSFSFFLCILDVQFRGKNWWLHGGQLIDAFLLISSFCFLFRWYFEGRDERWFCIFEVRKLGK